jgi:hypothetical protein
MITHHGCLSKQQYKFSNLANKLKRFMHKNKTYSVLFQSLYKYLEKMFNTFLPFQTFINLNVIFDLLRVETNEGS